MELKADFNGTDEELINKLRTTIFDRIMQGLKQEIDKQDIRLQSYIVSQKLSGQVLQHRSGTLSDSIRVIPAIIEGDQVKGGVEGAGGPAFYGRYFEEGGKGPYEIRPKTAQALHFFASDGSEVFAKKVMHPAIPHLPFMQPSLDELRDSMAEAVQASIIRSFNQAVEG